MILSIYYKGLFQKIVGANSKYYNNNFGEMQWYCAKSKNHVLVTLKDKSKIAFTPDEPDRFVNEVKRWLS